MRVNEWMSVVICSVTVLLAERMRLTLPVLYYLLPDHLHVFKALHAADVVHQDVGVGIPDTSAAQIQPLLKDRHTERKTQIFKHLDIQYDLVNF